ncbi:flagellar motor switch protein [uncultured Sulfitobacter sp.]|uniref:flagellar motor switch protein n=1 Tax=uncultured Sulfitobacter sp. TaxID=191468 RepID=UPI0026026377|nr:flagellar motor switch protein [uncultured Sulfitobacter sp.]
MLTTLIDVVIIVLLIGSIGYGYTVSRKVRYLMNALQDMETLVVQFSSAVEKSEHSVYQMRENIKVAETLPQKQRQQEEEQALQAAFSSGRRPAAAARSAPDHFAERPGLVVMRDKEDLVRKFFDNSPATSRV